VTASDTVEIIMASATKADRISRLRFTKASD
jgi:hypothetical protein